MEEITSKIEQFVNADFVHNFNNRHCDGFGDDYGYGYGNGSGNGGGDNNGYGYGCGYGNSCGTGYGSGNSDGSGFGWGDNFSIKSYNGYKFYCVDGIQTIIYNVRGNIARGAILSDDFTLKDCYIAKIDGCFAHGDTVHRAFEDAKNKALKGTPIEVRINKFVSKYPDYDKKIPAQELFLWHNILTGSCKLGREQFCEEHNINLNTDKFSPREFIERTIDSYGGTSIAKLKEEYNVNN